MSTSTISRAIESREWRSVCGGGGGRVGGYYTILSHARDVDGF